MTLQKTSNKSSQSKKVEIKVVSSPVVIEEKSRSFKDFFSMFSQFVSVGGDFA